MVDRYIAELPGLAANILDRNELVMMTYGSSYRPYVGAPRARFDEGLATFRANAQGVCNERLGARFRMQRGESVRFDRPRRAVIGAVLLNYVAYQPSQVSLTLRLLGVPVRSILGPSARAA